jgi:hypothetical protein
MNKNKISVVASKEFVRARLNDTVQAFKDGWNDSYMQRPFRSEYETANRVYQDNYERGRQAFIYAKMNYGIDKPWRGKTSANIAMFARYGNYHVLEDFPFEKRN